MNPTHFLRVVLCQLVSTDDVEMNRLQIRTLLAQIKNPTEVDLVVFPENSLFFKIGKKMPSSFLELHSPALAELDLWVQEHQVHMLLTTPLHEEGAKVSNATIWFKPQHSPQVVYRKIHLFDVDVVGQSSVRESDTFLPGLAPQIIEIKGWRLGLSICYDLRFAELYSYYASHKVDGLLVPAAFLVPTGQAHWHVLLRARAIESQCYVLAPAQGGVHLSRNEEQRSTFGHSLCVDPWGQVIAEAQGSPALLAVELQAERLQWVRQQIPQQSHRRL